jgi:hypothetical protein
MGNRTDRPASPFDKLLEVRRQREQADSQPSKRSDVQPSGQLSGLDSQTAGRLAKSADPDFTKFTVYIRRATHRAAKLRAVSEGRELSDVVEQLLTEWTAKQPAV